MPVSDRQQSRTSRRRSFATLAAAPGRPARDGIARQTTTAFSIRVAWPIDRRNGRQGLPIRAGRKATEPAAGMRPSIPAI